MQRDEFVKRMQEIGEPESREEAEGDQGNLPSTLNSGSWATSPATSPSNSPNIAVPLQGEGVQE